MARLDKKEIIQSILDETDILADEEEIVNLLIKENIAKNVNILHKDQLTVGDRMSDKLAKVAGSWVFVIGFLVMIAIWIIINAVMTEPVDAYPFILLNLLLSCVAAIQAPVIMMSQNRQEQKDRLRSQNDYKVNVKSELIVEDLHKKIDLLIENQKALLDKLNRG